MFRLIKNSILKRKSLKDSIIINFIYLFYLFFKYYIASGFRFDRIDRLSAKKTSETLVILGAGNSINELTKSQYDELNNYDVAGLSYSCVLPIKQTFYFYESPSAHETDLIKEHVQKVFPAVIEAEKHDRLECLIWKNAENKIFSEYVDLRNFICPRVCSILTDSPYLIKMIIRYCNKLGLNKYFLMQKRGSVVALVQFALLLHYKKIIFVGIDLNGKDYFFENTDEYNHYEFTEPYSFDTTYKNKGMHRTNDPEIGIPIIEVLKLIFEENDDAEFYVTSKDSALKSCLPLWVWRDDSSAS